MGSDPRPSYAVCATMYSQVQPTHMAERRPIRGSGPFTGLFPNRPQTIRGSELIGSLNESHTNEKLEVQSCPLRS
jgi:hypothetical protein